MLGQTGSIALTSWMQLSCDWHLRKQRSTHTKSVLTVWAFSRAFGRLQFVFIIMILSLSAMYRIAIESPHDRNIRYTNTWNSKYTLALHFCRRPSSSFLSLLSFFVSSTTRFTSRHTIFNVQPVNYYNLYAISTARKHSAVSGRALSYLVCP